MRVGDPFQDQQQGRMIQAVQMRGQGLLVAGAARPGTGHHALILRAGQLIQRFPAAVLHRDALVPGRDDQGFQPGVAALGAGFQHEQFQHPFRAVP